MVRAVAKNLNYFIHICTSIGQNATASKLINISVIYRQNRHQAFTFFSFHNPFVSGELIQFVT